MENIQLAENCKFSYAPSGNTIDRLAATNFELSGGKIEIEVRANADKLGDLRLKQGQQLVAEDLGIEVLQSQAGNPTAIEKTITLK